MFYLEAVFAFFQNLQQLDLFIWQIGFDALYKYGIYTMSVPAEQDDSFQLGG